jgi:NAD(P)-dependent dehydrogenase (short-subunit alcohol dehydrogenase family)
MSSTSTSSSDTGVQAMSEAGRQIPGARYRRALVTGAGRGIGRETAIRLAACGNRVLAVARTESDLRSLADAAPVEYLADTVGTAEGCERIAAEATRRLGHVDILVNNAGADAGELPIWDHDPATWDSVMAVNLRAAYELTRLLSGGMVERGWGRIIMVSSTAGSAGGPAMAAYCASKHGLLGLMRSVAKDVAPYGVTANAVAPGWVRTSMSEQSAAREAASRGLAAGQVWDERNRSYAAGRVADAAEVASVIAFLVSEEASGVNGDVITVALGETW